jgi:hypothetical protein
MAASLAAVLIANENSKIENVDVSFCGVGDKGVLELAQAIPMCTTLKSVNVRGNFMSSNALTTLVIALSEHQRKHGVGLPRSVTSKGDVTRKKLRYQQLAGYEYSDMSAHLGGLVVESVPKALSQNTYRSAIAYVSTKSSVEFAVLRRRISTALSPSTKSLSSSTTTNESTTSKYLHHIVCMRIQILQQYEGVYEVVEVLAKILRADVAQIKIVSCSEPDESNCCFVIFSPIDAPTNPTHQVATNSKHEHREVSSRKLAKIADAMNANSSLSADALIYTLIELAKSSSPMLRKIGVRTVFVQQRSGSGSGASTFHSHIRGAGYGGGGITKEYIPPLFPLASVMDNDVIAREGGDMSQDEIAAMVEEVTRVRSESVIMRQKKSADLDNEWFQDDDDEDETGKDRAPKDPVDEDDKFSEANISYAVASAEDIDLKLITSIETMKRNNELSAEHASFWRGIFGSRDCQSFVHSIENCCLDEDGIYQYTGIRKCMMDAMFRRDITDMTAYVTHISTHNIPGGILLNLCDKLLSELKIISQDSATLESLAQTPQEAYIVEQFLLCCARLGYAGDETIAAIELREYLVRWAVEDDVQLLSGGIEGVKQRAFLTNLMISRDIAALDKAIKALGRDSNNIASSTAERKEAVSLLIDCSNVKNKLTKAIKDRKLIDLEEAIAEAAYLNYYDDSVQEAVDVMLDLSCDPSSLTTILLEKMRNGSPSDLETVLAEIYRVGWVESPLKHDVVFRIYEERKRIVEVCICVRRMYLKYS